MILRNPLQPYSPAVLALTYAVLAVALYAWGMAFLWDRTPVRTWEGTVHGE